MVGGGEGAMGGGAGAIGGAIIGGAGWATARLMISLTAPAAFCAVSMPFRQVSVKLPGVD